MSWQDITIAAGSVSFSIALIPTVKGPSKPALTSSVITAFWLFIFAIVYASLKLWFACATEILATSVWMILAIQVVRGKRLTEVR
jgi:hypothetical protein